jgi:hypothetical protein
MRSSRLGTLAPGLAPRYIRGEALISYAARLELRLGLDPCSGYFHWTVKNAAGAAVTSQDCYEGDRQIDNLPAGQYTLEFSGTRDTKGIYSFELK